MWSGNKALRSGVCKAMATHVMLLSFLLVCGCRYTENQPPPKLGVRPVTNSAEMELSARLVGSVTKPWSVVLRLRNTGPQTIAVWTGFVMGHKTYPATLFHFSLERPDSLRFELSCASCAPATMPDGGPTPYKVFLNPREHEDISIPLSSITLTRYGISEALETSSTRGSNLVVTLQGMYAEPASWVGKAQVSTELP